MKIEPDSPVRLRNRSDEEWGKSVRTRDDRSTFSGETMVIDSDKFYLRKLVNKQLWWPVVLSDKDTYLAVGTRKAKSAPVERCKAALLRSRGGKVPEISYAYLSQALFHPLSGARQPCTARPEHFLLCVSQL